MVNKVIKVKNVKQKIGNVNIKNQVGLAPMAGISNPAYMKICEEMNVGFAVTELISSEAIVRNNKKTFDMLKGIDTLNFPVGIQIFGSSSSTMAEAARILFERFPKISFIDINMGCPVPKVSIKAQSGSGLLKNPDKVYEIVKETTKSVPIPITVKIRSGWDQSNINALEIAKICEKAGASAITIHPRTRSQGYSGKADWNIIKQIKENVKIPVIGNGDIKSCYDAKKMLDETKCDMIMIGRSALGNPWIIKETVKYLENNTIPKEITYLDKLNMISKHIDYLLENNSEKITLLQMRSHVLWYLKGTNSILKKQIMEVKSVLEFKELLNEEKKIFSLNN